MTTAIHPTLMGSASPLRQGVLSAHRYLSHAVEAAAALLVLAEVVVLFGGVVSRYVFNSPFTWTEELASSLFLWLAMLGAVIALDRGEHMRLTALVAKLPQRWQSWVATLAELTVCTFVLLVLSPAIEHAIEEAAITTPSLEIAGAWRVAALPAGIALMLIAALIRMIRLADWKQIVLGVAVIAVMAAAIMALQPALLALGNYNLLFFFVLLLGICVAGGVPIAFAFGIATVAYLGLIGSTPLSVVVNRMDEGMANMMLLAVPLFILLGGLLEMSGLARTLIEFMSALLGHLRGGLQFVLLGAMFLVSGISGAKVADMAAVAPALFPEMIKRGHKREDLVALISASAAMTETIPPSIVLITIGAVCGVSISALFVGGLMPAVVATLAIGLLCWFRARREPGSGVQRASLSVIIRTFLVALPALVLPFLIRAAVIEGIATATEVATIGVMYTVLVGLIMHAFQRQLNFRLVYPILVETATLSGAILLTIGMATAMSWALTQSGLSARVVQVFSHMPGGSAGFMLLSIVVFVVLGSVLEGIPVIVLFGPLLFPISQLLGINEVHYAMVVILSMGVGLFAPPLGVGFYAACSIGKVEADRVIGKVWGYIAVLLCVILLVAFVPWISTGFLK